MSFIKQKLQVAEKGTQVLRVTEKWARQTVQERAGHSSLRALWEDSDRQVAHKLTCMYEMCVKIDSHKRSP